MPIPPPCPRHTGPLALFLVGLSGIAPGCASGPAAASEDIRPALEALREGAARLQLARLEGDAWPELGRTELPLDPFSTEGEALRLAETGSGAFILYSVGPDGSDDGGRGRAPGETRGDIVLPLRVRP